VNNVNNERTEASNKPGQQVGNEAKDSSQQFPNEAHNFKDKGKNGFLDCNGNESEKTVDEEEDDLIGGLGQRAQRRAMQCVRTWSTLERRIASPLTSKRTPVTMLLRAMLISTSTRALMSATAQTRISLTSSRR